MKPIVVRVDKDSKVDLTIEEFQKLISDAYDLGYADGKKDSTSVIYVPTQSPTIKYPDTGRPWWEPQWTCNQSAANPSSNIKIEGVSDGTSVK